MRKTSAFVAMVALVTVAVLGCGKSQTQSGGGGTPTGRSRIVVFGAGYCTICKVRFPEIQALLDALPAAQRDAIDVELYVTAGDPASVRPTEEMALAYQARVKMKGTAKADPWRWQNFRRLIGTQLEVPAAAILDGSGRVQRVFTAGDTTFVPQEIVAVAQDVVSGAVK